jgi:hypothetical protein
MKDFLLIYRSEVSAVTGASPEEMQARMQLWMDWMGGIAAQNKLVDRGNRLTGTGKVLKDRAVVSDGPYTEIKESIMGYSLVKAGSLEEAAEMAKGCPIFKIGGSVEVREINVM